MIPDPGSLRSALALVAAFVLGGVPSALWVGRLARGVDVREHGSGNLGATNVYRTLGPALGWTVFALDALKGVGGVLLAKAIAGDAFPGGRVGAGLAGALAAVLGHVFTPFAGFKGGKGAATAAGAMIAVAPVAGALCLACFLVGVVLTHRISVGTITAALALPLLLWAIPFAQAGHATAIVGSLVSLLILVRHLPNIRRLLAGTEPAFEFRRRPGNRPGEQS
ncbi:MAG: glycerol-3-phosphate 1-O-acyltransferase PlsY [Candidatus Eisenbacteria bacterium]